MSMLSPLQESMILLGIPKILRYFNEDLQKLEATTLPVFFSEDLLDLPVIPCIAITFFAEGAHVPGWNTSAPLRVRYNHEAKAYDCTWGSRHSATLQIAIVGDDAATVKSWAYDAGRQLEFDRLFLYYNQIRVKMDEILSTERPIPYVEPIHSRHLHVAIIDVRLIYETFWTPQAPPIFTIQLNTSIGRSSFLRMMYGPTGWGMSMRLI